MRRNNRGIERYGGYIYALFIFFAVFFSLFAWLIRKLQMEYLLKSFWSLIGGFILFLGILILFFRLIHYLFKSISKKNAELRSLNKKCIHNVNVGRDIKCIDCERLKEEESKQREAQEQKILLKRKIEKHKLNEIERLKSTELLKFKNLQSVTPRQFEFAIAELFQKLGFTAQVTSEGNDGGIDIFLHREKIKYVVQCKQYSETNMVGRVEIQQFHSAILHSKAIKGFFVTTSSFNNNAIEYCKSKPIELYDKTKLKNLLSTIKEENLDTFTLLCSECLEPISFTIEEFQKEKCCSNGHNIKNDINPNILLTINERLAQSTKHKKRYRYY
jgi:restriction system protein